MFVCSGRKATWLKNVRTPVRTAYCYDCRVRNGVKVVVIWKLGKTCSFPVKTSKCRIRHDVGKMRGIIVAKNTKQIVR